MMRDYEEVMNHLLGYLTENHWVDTLRMYNESQDTHNIKKTWELLNTQDSLWSGNIKQDVWYSLPTNVRDTIKGLVDPDTIKELKDTYE